MALKKAAAPSHRGDDAGRRVGSLLGGNGQSDSAKIQAIQALRRRRVVEQLHAIFLRLNERFALGADDLQWILYAIHPRKGQPATWDGISFVRSTKDILLRCIREKGCQPTVEAQVALDAMPPTFDEWQASLPSCPVPVCDEV
jgi:hypothetical protein